MYLDAKLQWHKHQRIILQKVQRALSSLSRTFYSIWGLPVPTSRLVYIAILRSLLSYIVEVWFNPLRKLANISSLITFQNKCFRLIGGVFKATSVFLLESELFLLPLHLYFKFYTACFLSSIQNSFLKDYLDDIFSTISHYTSSLKMSQFWPSCTSGMNHTPCWKVLFTLFLCLLRQLPLPDDSAPPWPPIRTSSYSQLLLFFFSLFFPNLSSCEFYQVSSQVMFHVKFRLS